MQIIHSTKSKNAGILLDTFNIQLGFYFEAPIWPKWLTVISVDLGSKLSFKFQGACVLPGKG